jgi:hypothetical protein
VLITASGDVASELGIELDPLAPLVTGDWA